MAKSISIFVEDETYEKFTIALSINHTNTQDVLESYCKAYIARTFSNVAAEYSSEKAISEPNTVSDKVSRKVPLWARRKGQVCFNIIRAFLQLEGELNGNVSAESLSTRCSNPIDHPDTFVKNFTANFQQMRLDTEKSHGHVFDLKDGNVTICASARLEIDRHRSAFLA